MVLLEAVAPEGPQLQILTRVVLPMRRPLIAVLVVMTFMSWRFSRRCRCSRLSVRRGPALLRSRLARTGLK